MTGHLLPRINTVFIVLTISISLVSGCISTWTSESPIPTQLSNAPHPINTATFPTPDLIKTIPTLSEGTDVMIQGNDFEPYSLVVKSGTTVTWTNDDEFREYTVVSDASAPESFQSSPLSKGQMFRYLFTQPGTYTYYSSLPPEISGEIIVL